MVNRGERIWSSRRNCCCFFSENVGGDAPPDVPDASSGAQTVLLVVNRRHQDYARTLDPAGLLPEPFTLKDLRNLHEAVVGRPLMRDTFRRQIEPQLVPTGGISYGTRGCHRGCGGTIS